VSYSYSLNLSLHAFSYPSVGVSCKYTPPWNHRSDRRFTDHDPPDQCCSQIPTRTLTSSSTNASVYGLVVPRIVPGISVAPGTKQLMLHLINAINTQSRIIK
ncbi:hypothetical protein A2U01_0003840, partial [Trifolium medium]|nr:hypothetical protein [Trifolium medium]